MANIYANYWQRKALLSKQVPHFSVLRFAESEALSEVEALYFQRIQNAQAVLDFGAGDLRMQRKFRRAGYRGSYDTLDVAEGESYTYRSLDQVDKKYDVILCLDVLEHLPLQDGLELLTRLAALLVPGGSLVVQTPNARCDRHPSSWDMTHVHCYNAPDLWAFLRCLELEVTGHRVVFWRAGLGFRLRHVVAKLIVTQFLGLDYADNIVMLAKRPLGP